MYKRFKQISFTILLLLATPTMHGGVFSAFVHFFSPLASALPTMRRWSPSVISASAMITLTTAYVGRRYARENRQPSISPRVSFNSPQHDATPRQSNNAISSSSTSSHEHADCNIGPSGLVSSSQQIKLLASDCSNREWRDVSSPNVPDIEDSILFTEEELMPRSAPQQDKLAKALSDSWIQDRLERHTCSHMTRGKCREVFVERLPTKPQTDVKTCGYRAGLNAKLLLDIKNQQAARDFLNNPPNSDQIYENWIKQVRNARVKPIQRILSKDSVAEEEPGLLYGDEIKTLLDSTYPNQATDITILDDVLQFDVEIFPQYKTLREKWLQSSDFAHAFVIGSMSQEQRDSDGHWIAILLNKQNGIKHVWVADSFNKVTPTNHMLTTLLDKVDPPFKPIHDPITPHWTSSSAPH